MGGDMDSGPTCIFQGHYSNVPHLRFSLIVTGSLFCNIYIHYSLTILQQLLLTSLKIHSFLFGSIS